MLVNFEEVPLLHEELQGMESRSMLRELGHEVEEFTAMADGQGQEEETVQEEEEEEDDSREALERLQESMLVQEAIHDQLLLCMYSHYKLDIKSYLLKQMSCCLRKFWMGFAWQVGRFTIIPLVTL